MFFAKEGQTLSLSGEALAALRQTQLQDPQIECCIFRSAYWPYYGYPRGFVATRNGVYRVRFRARSVLQQKDYTIAAGDRDRLNPPRDAHGRRLRHARGFATAGIWPSNKTTTLHSPTSSCRPKAAGRRR